MLLWLANRQQQALLMLQVHRSPLSPALLLALRLLPLCLLLLLWCWLIYVHGIHCTAQVATQGKSE